MDALITTTTVGPEGGHVFTASNDGSQSAGYVTVEFGVTGSAPDVVVQSSPLLRPVDLGPVEETIARQYELGADFTVAAADPDNVYDWQDEFYLPLSGFKAIQRPGSEFEDLRPAVGCDVASCPCP